MDWQDRIIVDPQVLVGKPVIKGTRIAVEFVMDLLGRGWTTEQKSSVSTRPPHSRRYPGVFWLTPATYSSRNG